MFHYVNAIQDTKGNALIGFYVRLTDATTGVEVDIFADDNSTPIVSVSGVDNACLVDSNGDADFYVPSGSYNVVVYATDSTTQVHQFNNIPMVDPSVTVDLAALEAQVEADIANLITNQTQNGVASGCGVVYDGNLQFTVSAGTVYIAGALIAVAQQDVTLDAADGSHDRIDVIYVNDAGTVGKITGTAAASPSAPVVDPTTQCYLTFVSVPTGATSLSGITSETIYDEGAEWTVTTSGTGFTANSTNAAYSGTKSIEVTNATSGSYVKFVRSSSESFDGDGSILLRIKSKATWANKRTLVLRWYLAGVLKSATLVQLRDGAFGFTSSNITDWQLIVIPKAAFGIPTGASIDELRISDSGGSLGCYIDDIILQNTGTTTGGNTTFLTYDLADARYLKLTGGTTTGAIRVPDVAYDATVWNGNTSVPTMNAVRDKIETLVAGGSNTPNALTIDNSGSGAASGATFNGSAPVTISTNTIGAQPLDSELTALAGLTSAANKIPYFTGSGAASLLTRDTDTALAGNSDTALATQKAVKAYVDSNTGTATTAGSTRPFVKSGTGIYIPADTSDFGTSTVSTALNLINFLPFSRKCTIDALVFEVTTAAGAGNNSRMGIYTANATTGMPDTLIQEATLQAIDSTGVKVFPLSGTYSVTGVIWIAFVHQATCTLRATSSINTEGLHRFGQSSLNTSTINNRIGATFSYAALPADTSGLTMSVGQQLACIAVRNA